MDIHNTETSEDLDARTYIRMLIAIAKADPENGPPEFEFVRRKARHLGLDFDRLMQDTDKTFLLDKQEVSRLTALAILKDAIFLASRDRNFSLPERQRVYTYAEKLNIPRKDVDELEALVKDFHQLNRRWRQLVQLR